MLGSWHMRRIHIRWRTWPFLYPSGPLWRLLGQPLLAITAELYLDFWYGFGSGWPVGHTAGLRTTATKNIFKGVSARPLYCPPLPAPPLPLACGLIDRRAVSPPRRLPASRQYAALHHLNGRRLTIGQFMERACRLSANGRTEIYRLRGRKRLCQCREAFTAAGSKSGTAHQNHITTDGLSLGLCAAHIWPN